MTYDIEKLDDIAAKLTSIELAIQSFSHNFAVLQGRLDEVHTHMHERLLSLERNQTPGPDMATCRFCGDQYTPDELTVICTGCRDVVEATTMPSA